MKKLRLVMAAVLVVSLLAGCDGSGDSQAPSDSGGGVSITVVTPFSESDGNRGNYVSAYEAFEQATGNTIVDVETAAVDENWKQGVLEDFRNGNEPDVIDFFIGADADELIANNKFVSISEIRKEFPDYASNMKESLIPVSTYDGRQYAVPVYGYWEGLFVNKKVLEDCGVAIPGAGYTWEQFLADCQTIKDKGYTPIACSLTQIPHYWFEYCVFNNGTVTDHAKLPLEVDDTIGQSWVAGLNDIKALYDAGFFPPDTLEANDDTTAQMILENKAAFLLDGSWKVGWFQDNAEAAGADLNDFTVTYVPSRGIRKSTDAIGGISMGYSITRKAWDDPVKRKVCVDFITAMTSDEVTSTFGELTVTALKNGITPSGAQLNALAESTIAMTKGCTAMVPAAQDALTPSARDALFNNIPNIVRNKITAEKALEECLALE
ncbi:MAG: ABC transporter substrate-binding protein [Coriobacteriales bacterium]|jgi:raffinose/stachyose/melibiose transport system substrate-binding protein|nr:ABC transporter substrate-binding protein [Coriobacteriales bacterium]